MVLPAGPHTVVLLAEPPFVVLMAEPRLRGPYGGAAVVALLAEPRFAVPMARPPCALLMAEQSMCAVSGRGSALPITALS